MSRRKVARDDADWTWTGKVLQTIAAAGCSIAVRDEKILVGVKLLYNDNVHNYKVNIAVNRAIKSNYFVFSLPSAFMKLIRRL